MDEFITTEVAAESGTAPMTSQPEPAKPKTKRSARPKNKKKASLKDLPDLSNFAALFGCLHWLKDGAHDDWDEAFDKANESGVSIIMEGKEIKGVILPYDTYNDLIGVCVRAQGGK